MKCNGCGEDFHGAASCQANLRWLLGRARDEIARLKTVTPSVEVPVLLQSGKAYVNAQFEKAVKPSRSEQMKAIWAARKAAKVTN